MGYDPVNRKGRSIEDAVKAELRGVAASGYVEGDPFGDGRVTGTVFLAVKTEQGAQAVVALVDDDGSDEILVKFLHEQDGPGPHACPKVVWDALDKPPGGLAPYAYDWRHRAGRWVAGFRD